MDGLLFRIKRRLGYWGMFVKYLTAYLLRGLYKNKEMYRDLWIIAERGVDARDNGYFLFRYMRREHPEYNVRFIISEDSPDRKKAEETGPVINYRSFAHYLAIALSEVKISSHVCGYTPETCYFTIVGRRGLIPGIKIFLQHGIIKDDLPFLYYENTQLDLFVCGAKREMEYIRANYGYPAGIVRYLGLCRYDNLPVEKNRKRSRIILLMPTWRRYLEKLSVAAFKKTRICQVFERLFFDGSLEALLGRYDYELVFYPHHELQKYLSAFMHEDSGQKPGRVRFASEMEEDLQRLLIQADVLVTDYSSVYFDFAYMEKPVVYYQFDEEEYRKGHYARGYFSYELDGFGKVTRTQEELLLELDGIFARGGGMEEQYAARVKEFFTKRDKENCKRNFEAILDVQQKRKTE